MDDDTLSFLDDINEQVSRHVDRNFQQVHAAVLGLDPRGARILYVTDECIAVKKQDDSRLQYYGGFEYVDKEARTEMGDYVFYMATDNRVQNHIDRWLDTQREDGLDEDPLEE
jgi:hypothetical protein